MAFTYQDSECFYYMTNLLIADAMARRSGNNRVAAITRCAKVIRDKANDGMIKRLSARIIKEKDSARIIEMADSLLVDCINEGLLPEDCKREV